MEKIIRNHYTKRDECIYTGDAIFIIGKDIIRLSDAMQFLVVTMNGKNTDGVVKQKFEELFNVRLQERNFYGLVCALEDNGLLLGRVDGYLASALSPSYLKRQRKRFVRKKVRNAIYAGNCYSGTASGLRRQLKKTFGFVDQSKLCGYCKDIQKIKGIIVPHSNMEFSGPCAAWAYEALRQNGLPELVIILGAYHARLNSYHTEYSNTTFGVLLKDFRSPLGMINADMDFGRRLSRNCGFDIFGDPLLHIGEHSIEMQLPFLQYIYGMEKKPLSILPIICRQSPEHPESFTTDLEQFAEAVRKTTVDSKKEVAFIASGDLLHDDISSVTFHRRNKKIIKLLSAADLPEFRLQTETEIYKNTFCGREPFLALLQILGRARAKVLNYSWSGESELIKGKHKLQERYDNFTETGFVSMLFY